jgi:electron transfer flavoprotein alpha subunit
MKHDAQDVWVFAETGPDGVKPISLALTSRGRELADTLGVGFSVVLMGQNLTTSANQLLTYGADCVLVADDAELQYFDGDLYAQILVNIVRERRPSFVLFGQTYKGMDTAAIVAAKLRMPLISNCVELQTKDGEVVIKRLMCNSTVVVNVQPVNLSPLLLSFPEVALRVGIAKMSQGGTIVPSEVKTLVRDVRIKLLEIVQPTNGDVDISKSDILVAAGAGIEKKENLKLVEALAEALGGTLACSRRLVDKGWLPTSRQVGLSGKTVKPKLYVACGISGAVEHIAGMIGSSMIVAINKDPKAPIFHYADYAIVADLNDVLPIMIETTKGKRIT